MWFQTKQFIRFLAQSTNQHGVHSPFVYNLVTKCFYNKQLNSLYPDIRRICQNGKIKKRKTLHTLQLISRIITYLNIKKVLLLESPEVQKEIHQLMSLHGLPDISETIDNDTIDCDTYDFIYLDINTYTQDTVSLLSSVMHNDTLLLVNDIHTSDTTISIWEEIKNRPEVRVTIDTYHLGLIFFRKEQAKEHFVIRV